MARLNHASQSGGSQNPAEKYISWKSNDKCFSYFDKSLVEGLTDKDEIKEKGNVEVALPLKFILLQHYHTVKGWHDSSSSAIYANEVYFIGNEELNVRAFKGGPIASGLYKEIKGTIKDAGGSYHRSIYVVLEDGSTANISIKGSAVKEWSDFYELTKNTHDNKWIEVKEAVSQKKGSISYSTPKFSLGDNLDKKAVLMADNAADTLKTYMDNYFEKSTEEAEPLALADDLKF
jgi:hypothetical protein